MEVTGNNPDLVHVLRHGFRPNEPLQFALASLMTTGPDGSHSFSRKFPIYGSDERVVDIWDVAKREFAFEKSEANKEVERYSKSALQLQPELAAHVLKSKSRGAVALRLVFTPSDVAEYARLRGALDKITFGIKRYTPGFHATRLYVDLPFDDLKPIPEVREGIADMRQGSEFGQSSTNLYQVIPNNRLSSEFMARSSRKLIGYNSPPTDAA